MKKAICFLLATLKRMSVKTTSSTLLILGGKRKISTELVKKINTKTK